MNAFIKSLLYRRVINYSFCARKEHLYTSPIMFTAKVIHGKVIKKKILAELKKEVHEWVGGGHKRPNLKIVKVGIAQKQGKYTESVLQACKEIGILAQKMDLPEEMTEIELLAVIRGLNEDPEVDGIMLELPLPEHITERIMCNAVAPHKDVNGYNIVNVGRLTQQQTTIVPCMAAAIKEIILRQGIPTQGKNIVMCGRSRQIGLPFSIIAGHEEKGEIPGMNATVTLCHTSTPKEQIAYFVKNADIVVVSCGVPGLIDATMLKEGAFVIDVGTFVLKDPKSDAPKMVADLNLEEVKKIAAYITPVPGGVGPVAIAMTVKNVITLAKRMVEYDVFEPGAALYHALEQLTP